MKENKRISASVLLKHDEAFEQKEVTIDIEGEKYTVKIDQKFRISKIQSMILEGLNNYKNYSKLDESVRMLYFVYLIMKYFTDMDLRQAKTFKHEVRLMNSLLDLNIIEQVFEHIPEGEILKVREYMDKVEKAIEKIKKQGKSVPELKNIISKEVVEK